MADCKNREKLSYYNGSFFIKRKKTMAWTPSSNTGVNACVFGDIKMLKKKEDPGAVNVSRRKRRVEGQPKNNSIVMFLGREIKEYKEKTQLKHDLI